MEDIGHLSSKINFLAIYEDFPEFLYEHNFYLISLCLEQMGGFYTVFEDENNAGMFL